MVHVPLGVTSISLLDYVALTYRLGDDPDRECDMWDQIRDEWQPTLVGDPIFVHAQNGGHILIRTCDVGRCLGLEDALWYAHDGPL